MSAFVPKRARPFNSTARAAGVKITGNLLFLACVEWNRDGVLKLHREGCRKFELAERGQRATIELRQQVRRFCQISNITELYLRGAPERGDYAGSNRGAKIEAILELIPKIEMHTVATNKIGAWVRTNDPTLPEMRDNKMLVKDQKKLKEAIETAAYIATVGKLQATRARNPRRDPDAWVLKALSPQAEGGSYDDADWMLRAYIAANPEVPRR